MICIASSTGPIAAANRRLRPAMMPSGIPISNEMSTAASIWASVAMPDSHSPSAPIAAKPMAPISASRQPPKISPSPPDRAITPGQPRPASSPSNAPTRPPIPTRISSRRKNELRFTSIHSRKALSVSKSG